MVPEKHQVLQVVRFHLQNHVPLCVSAGKEHDKEVDSTQEATIFDEVPECKQKGLLVPQKKVEDIVTDTQHLWDFEKVKPPTKEIMRVMYGDLKLPVKIFPWLHPYETEAFQPKKGLSVADHTKCF